MLLIVFTLLILVGLQNFGTVIGAIVFSVPIIYPFALGGAIAFIINIPMKFVERNVFGRRKLRQGRSGRLVKKLSRPLSLVIALILILAVIAIVFGGGGSSAGRNDLPAECGYPEFCSFHSAVGDADF